MTTRSVTQTARLRTLGFVVAGGVVLSIAAFLLTSTTPSYKYLGGPGYQTIDSPRFDPWSGQPHGQVWTFPNEVGDASVVVEPVPEELSGRQAIPIPLGIALGSVVTLGFDMVMARRRRPEHRAL